MQVLVFCKCLIEIGHFGSNFKYQLVGILLFNANLARWNEDYIFIFTQVKNLSLLLFSFT